MRSYQDEFVTASGNTEVSFTNSWISSSTEIPITWFNCMMSYDWFDKADMLKDELVFRIATYRRALFKTKINSNFKSKINTSFKSKFKKTLYATRSFKGKQSIRR